MEHAPNPELVRPDAVPRDEVANGGDFRLRQTNLREMVREALQGLEELDEVVTLILLCYFAGYREEEPANHVLIEGINGLSKTRVSSRINAVIIGKPLRLFFDLVGWDPYQRSQGNPDLTPSDLIGTDVLGRGRRVRFREGPLLKQYLVYYADELNRSPPKTQSALLSVMSEGKVIVDSQASEMQARRIRKLPGFFLLASQNPMHHEGVYPLPEAMLDRFLVMIQAPYTGNLKQMLLGARPPREPDLAGQFAHLIGNEEVWGPLWKRVSSDRPKDVDALITHALSTEAQGEVTAAMLASWLADLGRDGPGPTVLSEPMRRTVYRVARAVESWLFERRRAELNMLKDEVSRVEFGDAAADYAAKLVYATWPPEVAQLIPGRLREWVVSRGKVRDLVKNVAQGCSPRAANGLKDLSRAVAWAEGSKSVTREHIKKIAPHVLRHRISLRFEAAMNTDVTTDSIVRAILDGLP